MSVRARWMQRRWAEAEGAYRRLILDSLEPQPSARLLDLGCDDGEWIDVVRRRLGVPPEQVSGLELVEARAEIARTRGFDVHHGDLDEGWPFEDASFDVVHANQVIEHVGRLDHFVEETRRVVRPGGRVVVGTENPCELAQRRRSLDGLSTLFADEHLDGGPDRQPACPSWGGRRRRTSRGNTFTSFR
jgi:SAM-dependent methyltransferase